MAASVITSRTRPRFLAMQAVPPPLRARRVAHLMAWAFGVLCLAVAVAPWIQNVGGGGRVIALTPLERQQVLRAPISGQVERWHVREGDRVSEGDLLVELVDNDPQLVERLVNERAALLAKLESYEQRTSTLEGVIPNVESAQAGKVGGAEAKVRASEEKVRAEVQSLEAAKASERTAKLNLERVSALFTGGLVSKRDLELAELEVRKTETNRAGAEAALLAAKQELEAFRAALTEAQSAGMAYVDEAKAKQQSASADASTVRASLQKVEAELSRQSMRKVRAPRDGTVLRFLAFQGIGAQVKLGDELLILVPDTTQRAVELWVDGNDAALVAPGRPVRLQFEGWPALQFSGWPSVAVGTFGGKVSFVDAIDNGHGDFRVVVVPDELEPWPESRFLRQGVRANGWILLDQVPLGFELWRRFNGFPPTVAPPADSAPVASKGQGK